jgi:hypothetical protein
MEKLDTLLFSVSKSFMTTLATIKKAILFATVKGCSITKSANRKQNKNKTAFVDYKTYLPTNSLAI